MKRYVAEARSADVARSVSQARYTSTSLVSRAEVSAVLAKAVSTGALSERAAKTCLDSSRLDWPALIRVELNESIVAQADSFAWEHGLRGYDAVHLASAWVWQDAMGGPVTVATFDKQLWSAAKAQGLSTIPATL